jgi:hypothetical protein
MTDRDAFPDQTYFRNSNIGWIAQGGKNEVREKDEISYQHIVAVGITSIFPGFRSFIGWAGLFGLIVSAILIFVGNLPAQPPPGVAVKSPPCNRTELVARDDVRPNWGTYTQSSGRTYITMKGLGACEFIMGEKQFFRGYWWRHVYEVPAPAAVNQEASVPRDNSMWQVGFFLGLCSGALLVGLWLPATILAAAGRRLMGGEEVAETEEA